jgi:hypothetical protein
VCLGVIRSKRKKEREKPLVTLTLAGRKYGNIITIIGMLHPKVEAARSTETQVTAVLKKQRMYSVKKT